MTKDATDAARRATEALQAAACAWHDIQEQDSQDVQHYCQVYDDLHSAVAAYRAAVTRREDVTHGKASARRTTDMEDKPSYTTAFDIAREPGKPNRMSLAEVIRRTIPAALPEHEDWQIGSIEIKYVALRDGSLGAACADVTIDGDCVDVGAENR